MDYSEMLMHGAAGLQGMSQGMMSSRAAQKFNAGSGGYGDLAKRKMWSDSLNNQRIETQQTGSPEDPDAIMAKIQARRARERGGAASLLDASTGQPSGSPQKAASGGSLMKGVGSGMSMFGMGK
jgi:hypothetical protein